MTKEVRQIVIDGARYSVVAVYQDDQSDVEWYDIIDAQGHQVNEWGLGTENGAPDDQTVELEVKRALMLAT